MKKYLCLFGVLVALSSQLQAGTIRDASGGGPFGYNSVYTETGIFTDYIKCRGQGYETCPKTLGMPGSPEDNSVQYALDQISNNVLSGQHQNVSYGYNILWNAVDSTGLSSMILVWPIGSQQPAMP